MKKIFQEAVMMNENPLRKLYSRWSVAAVLLMVFLFASSITGLAQSTQGSILGTVKDANGALVAGANVTLTNIDEGVVRTTKTNSSGNFEFPDAVAAHYNVSISAPGFETWKISGAQLASRQELRVNATLTVGSVNQSIQVSGTNATAIDTESASINAVYSAAEASNLPTNSRAGSNGTSGLSLVGTLPGVTADQGSYALQGALPFQTEVQVDGITIQSTTGDSPIQDELPSTDAIAEIRADGVMNNAEISQPGEITFTSKGGGNHFHGSAYWYFQNADFDALTFGATTKPHKVGNTFGGRFSGPVVIPHLYDGHNKFFIYAGYEGYRFPQQTAEQYTVPTAAMKTGDFSNYTANGFTGLTDPFTGGSYGTTLPSDTINSASQQFLQFFPNPNVTNANGNLTSYIDGEVPNYYVNKDSSQKSNQFDVRPDKYFGSNQKILLWGRFSHKNFPSTTPEALGVPEGQNTNINNSLTTSFNWTLKPNLINEFRFGFTLSTTGSSNAFNGKSFTEGLGLVGLQNLFYNGIPELDFADLNSLNADRLTSLTKSNTYVYTDSLTWLKGNHAVKVGMEIRKVEAITPLSFNGSDNYGTFGYSNAGSAVGMFTGVDFADFLLGLPNNTFYDVVEQDNDGEAMHYGFYAQDQWKALPNLTISYGIRYEFHPGYHDPSGDIGNFDPTVPLSGRSIYPDGKQSLLAQSFLASANACDADGVNNTNSAIINGAPCMPVQTNSQAGYPSYLHTVPKDRFMPRVGFAYTPFNNVRNVIRGGFSMYNIDTEGGVFYSLTGTLQAQTTAYTNTYNPSTQAIGYQWPNIYAGAGNGGCTTCYGQDYFGTANSIHWKDPYTEQWALSIDHDFGGGYAARITYIGDETRDLASAPDENTLPYSSTVSATNQPYSARLFPNWGRINTRDSNANESYNSLQLDASHRLQHGLEFDTDFTWSKALANNQGPDSTSFAGETGGARSTSILDPNADFGNVEGNRRLLWNSTALYDLPIGRGRKFGTSMPRALDAVIGGWRISNILTVETGEFLTPYFPAGEGDSSGTGSGLTSTNTGWDPGHRDQHADNVPGVSWKPSSQNRNHWVNAAAFTCPGYSGWTVGTPCTTGSGAGPVPLPIGRFGNSQVGTVVGPGTVNLNSGLVKTINLTDKIKLSAEGTFTNVLNHTNLSQPNLNLDSSSFGTIISGTGGRVGQVSMRLEF